jgi:hypothetical protein
MITRRVKVVAAIVVLVGTLACAESGDNGTGLPDGKVKSNTYKSRNNYEICVTPEGGGQVKCKRGWTKDEVKDCAVGDYWPDCYHLPAKQAGVRPINQEEVTTWQHV